MTLLVPLALGLASLAGAQIAGCTASSLAPAEDAGADSGGTDAGAVDVSSPNVSDDAGITVSCNVNGADPVHLCLEKSILKAEHPLFDAKAGIASSWNTMTLAPNADGGVVAHDLRDDVAYGAALSLYLISEREYGDTQIDGIVTADLFALAPIVEAELATLPASYDGELYMRLRRFAEGLSTLQDPTDSARVSAIADNYGRAIYATYFHPLAGGPDAGAGDGGGSSDASDDAASDAGIDAAPPVDAGDAAAPLGDGIIGTPSSSMPGAFAYDVDQAASASLALLDLANRNATTDAADAVLWARAAASVLNHLYARARHSNGLYYSYLVTSADPDHDALDTVLTPNDTLLTDTQASVAASLLRAYGVVQLANVQQPSQSTLGSLVVLPMNALQGPASLWDTTATSATTAACATIAPSSGGAPSCGGSGFFFRDLPSTSGVDTSAKTIRSNALLFAAVHRAIVSNIGTTASAGAAGDGGILPLIDYEPLVALFTVQAGIQVSFLTAGGTGNAYPASVTAGIGLVTGASYTAQANAYAIEALTEQWVGEKGCPTEFF